MKVEQIYSLVNDIYEEVVGEESILLEDLSNVVQVGDTILNSISYDNYVRKLVDHIGKVDFHNRIYEGGAPTIYKDSWEYGSIREKISFVMPEAEENPAWKLQDGNVYEQDTFTAPEINVTFYNGRTTYQIPLSITERQVKESFSSASQLNSFISGLQVAVENAITIRNDQLIMETIDSMIAHTLAVGVANKVDLLSMYNTKFNKSLAKADALTDADFIKFASYVMGLFSDRITRVSKLFNNAGQVRFTPKDKLHVVLLSEFAKAADSYLQSDTFHEQFTALPQAETVPYWQGSGTDYGFDSTSKIDVTVQDITSNDPTKTVTVEQDGIIGVMFDDWAVGVTNYDRRTTSHVNAVGEFTNYWYKVDAEYFNDNAENFIVFYLGEGSEPTIVWPELVQELTNARIFLGEYEDDQYTYFVPCDEGYTWTETTNEPTVSLDGDALVKGTDYYTFVFTSGGGIHNCRINVNASSVPNPADSTLTISGTATVIE